MISIAMARAIRCPRERVWRALVSPGELIRWDVRRVALEQPAPDFPAPGQTARWRCTLGSLTVALREESLEMVPAKRLRCAVRLGAFGFEETWTLADEAPDATRLSLRVSADNSVPLLGGELDRFDVRRLTTERVDETLRRVQEWCEAAPA